MEWQMTGVEAKIRTRRDERGVSLIEFALVLPFLLVLTLGVIDISRAFYLKNVLEQAAREGVRYGVVLSWDTQANRDYALAEVQQRARQVAGAANVTIVSVSAVPSAERMLQVTVNGQFNWILPGLFRLMGINFQNPVALDGKATMRREGP